MAEVRVVGGKIVFRSMTLKLQKDKPGMYDMKKVFAWRQLLQDGMKPVKWLKPNKNGTGVKFTSFESIEDFQESMKQLEEFVAALTKQQGE